MKIFLSKDVIGEKSPPMGSALEGERGFAVRPHTGAEPQTAAACVLCPVVWPHAPSDGALPCPEHSAIRVICVIRGHLFLVL